MRAIKLAAAALAALLAIAAGLVAVAAWMGERKLERRIDVRVVPVPFTREPAALPLGREIYETRCASCHGPDGAGRTVEESPSGLDVRAPNLTGGRNGAVASYGEADWVRAIRHGVNPAGHALLYMPSEEYNRMPDSQLAALVAYIRALPAVDAEAGGVRLPLHLKAFYGAGLMRDATELIDHRRPPPAETP